MTNNLIRAFTYLNEEEYSILKALAEIENKSISEYIKTKIIERDFTPGPRVLVDYSELRDKSILIRVSSSEKAQLDKNARDCGMTTAGYIRQRCLNSDSDFVMVDQELLRHNHYELCKQGTNLNQIADRLNSAKGDRLIPEIESLEQAIYSALDIISELAYKQIYIIDQGE